MEDHDGESVECAVTYSCTAVRCHMQHDQVAMLMPRTGMYGAPECT